jgi:hypothetical protein
MTDADNPCVLVSASFHRSGSTWLQRVIAAGSDTFMWGESGKLVPSLRAAAELWRKRAPVSDRERSDFLASGMASDIGISNMSPPEDEFIDAQRTLFRRLYAERYGKSRWGWKAVTYDVDDIRYLWELFPALKVILLVRDLVQVYLSLRALSWQTQWAGGPREIAELWARRSVGYATLAEDSRALFLKYEETRDRIGELASFLQLRNDQHLVKALDTRLSTTSQATLPHSERDALVLAAGDALQSLGYPLRV